MNTTVPTTTTPAKITSPRRSRFPGKESGSVSFNLTALGRQLLKEQAASASVSNGDYVEMLIRERAGMTPLRLPATAKQTGPKGGARYFKFIDRAVIGPQTIMVLCQVGGKYYVLATSPKSITLIDRLDEAPAPIVGIPSDLSFKSILGQLQQRSHES